MTSKIVNRQDLDFLMYDVLGLDQLFQGTRFDGYDRESINAMLDSAQKIAEEHFLPYAADVDAFHPKFEEGAAITHPSVKTSIQAFIDAGLVSLGFDHNDGGMDAPVSVEAAINGLFLAANISSHGYIGLTVGAAKMLSASGSEQQKKIYLQAMIDGRWFGTMCLSEPHAGSSLADIRTKALPQEDGSYSIEGTKMWISGGAQDISENIINFVLAKIPGGPPGVKGISLFIVPKIRVDEQGQLGQDNNIALVGLNHKMGYTGTTNTLLSFGEKGTCQGYLLGEAHRGLLVMFQMMNELRIGVGQGACMLGLAGYLHSLDYAKERRQGQKIGSKSSNSPQVPIIQHADVKRLLLSQKSAVEGAHCFSLYCASLVDQLKIAETKEAATNLELLLSLLTPIAKSWPSEFCLEANKHAIQILGGAGYTKDHPVERFYRDNRLNAIHEGAHAIHGLDILGRKVRLQQGAALKIYSEEVSHTINEAKQFDRLSDETSTLQAALNLLIETTQSVTSHADQEQSLANASLYLDSFGHVTVAWMWLKQGVALHRNNLISEPFGLGKISAMKFFFEYELPRIHHWLDLVGQFNTTCMDVSPEHF